MSGIIVVGTQWGDEGKGKITDLLAEDCDAGVRSQGGANAGHTIVVEVNGQEMEIITHECPSTIIRGLTSIIGRGTVTNPVTLAKEIDYLKEKLKPFGYDVESKIFLDEGSSMIMPWHILEDVIGEMLKGKGKIGSTAKGIGPTYTDRYSRNGLRAVDFLIDGFIGRRFDEIIDAKKLKINRMVEDLNKLPGMDEKRITLDKIIETLSIGDKPDATFARIYAENASVFSKQLLDFYMPIIDNLADKIKDTSVMVNEMLKQGKNVLFEGAQGFALSVVHGTYPYVTSSNPIASAAISETGFNQKYVEKVVGVVKAYTTRVGAGPFAAELADEKRLAAEIAQFKHENGKDAKIKLNNQEMFIFLEGNKRNPEYSHVLGKALMVFGGEYGATTGRPRRCGWFEAPLVKRAVEVNGTTELALTKLDVLDGLSEISIVTSYEYAGPENRYIKNRGKSGTSFSDFPFSAEIYSHCKPILKTMPGWKSDTSNVRSYDELPENARNYIEEIEKLVGCRVGLVSVGRERSQTFEKK
ncbi:MAG: adenylosuccinate synthetase [Nanoarchaeota archaeon]|nr:adenylosuccinate synthetase [Nanoarchaeota archaeon]